ncbi:hypothetical protein CEXT_390951 [Caerostris extrusa]|uniref:Uncharacterized protein n=1 Tax=Caerostris extrusa TaxID=172846 RepID=A0AAV4RRR7_CAEEX|nr:hypothetical protein CEXT_390951 [Caerostris extrusa]
MLNVCWPNAYNAESPHAQFLLLQCFKKSQSCQLSSWPQGSSSEARKEIWGWLDAGYWSQSAEKRFYYLRAEPPGLTVLLCS